jgi:hypothetical protein
MCGGVNIIKLISQMERITMLNWTRKRELKVMWNGRKGLNSCAKLTITFNKYENIIYFSILFIPTTESFNHKNK